MSARGCRTVSIVLAAVVGVAVLAWWRSAPAPPGIALVAGEPADPPPWEEAERPLPRVEPPALRREDRAATHPPTPAAQVVQRVEAEAATPTAGARLRIRVLDTGAARPLAGFRLIVEPETPAGTSFELTTDEFGEAVTERGLQRGILGFRHEPQPGSDAYVLAWQVVESSRLFEPGRAAATLVLHARPPQLEVSVEARHTDGSPAVGCELQLVSGRASGGGSPAWSSWRFAHTDDQGLARFPVHDEDWRELHFAAALREPVGEEVSETLLIEPPIPPGPWRLQLHPGSRLLVRVVQGDERPAEGLRVAVHTHDGTRPRSTRLVETDAQGEARFGPLPDGTFTVAAYPAQSRERLTHQEVELGQRAVTELLLRVGEPASEELVVSGRVLEADGEPATEGMLLVSRDGRAPERVFLDAEGTFAYRSAKPCSQVVVHAATSIYTGPIEPERAVVPAGTTGLEFRYTSVAKERLAYFELVDARTQEPISDDLDAAVVLYREPAEGEPVTARSFFGPDGGTTYVDFHPHPDLRWLVSVPGYRERRGVLETPAADAQPSVHRVELEPGFEREVVVRDAESGRRLAGVVLRVPGGRVLTRTAGDGSAVLAGTEWPGPLELVEEGYETLEWNPSAHWSTFSPYVRMRPER